MTMFHYDAVKNPTPAQQGIKEGKKSASKTPQHRAYLESHPYNEIDEDDLTEVRNRIFYGKLIYFFKRVLW